MHASSPDWRGPLDPGPVRDGFDFRRWAFLLGVGSGLLILVGAFLLALFMLFLGVLGAWPVGWLGIHDGGGYARAAFLVAIWGLLAGALVVFSASMMRAESENALLPALGMVAGGLLSFFAMGGFVIGGIGAIVAGVFALVAAPPMAFERAPRMRTRQDLS